jgi:hypothetical protein
MTRTERPSVAWIGEAELRHPAGLVLTFQRYALPEPGFIHRAPASLGALPVGLADDGDLLLPLAPRECFWIGLNAEASQALYISLAIERPDGALTDVLSGGSCEPDAATVVALHGMRRIEGIRRSDGTFDPLLRADGEGARPQGRRLHVWLRRTLEGVVEAVVAVELVDYSTFTERTGLPPPEPLDPAAGYKGWRLP